MIAPSVDFGALFAASPYPCMVVDRELRYVAANRAYLRVTATPREEDLVGRGLFEVFPNDPGDPNNQSAAMLRESLERVVRTGRPDELALIPYRVATTPGGPLEHRYWSATHTPLLDERGQVMLVVQHTIDVTEVQRAQAPGASQHLGAAVLDRAARVQDAVTGLASEARDLRQLFAQAPGLMAYLRGPEHVFELANQAYQELVGRRGIVGTKLREVLPELEGQGYVELLDRVLATGEPFVGHAMAVSLRRGPAKDLEERFVDFVFQPIADATGQVVGIFVQGVDITEQKRAQAERERLVAIVDQSSDFVGSADAGGRVSYVNPAGRRLLALPDDVTRTSLVDYFLPEDRPFVEQAVLPAVRRDGRWRGELRLRDFATGEPIQVDCNLFALVDERTGEPRGMATVTRDLRDDKRMERERASLVEEQRFLAESIPQQVWTAVPDGRLDFVNQQVVDYFHVSSEALLGEGWQSRIHPEDLEPCLVAWTRSLATGERYQVEFRLRGGDDVYRWYLGRAIAQRDAAGHVLKWFGTNTDIDEARRAHDELRARAEYEAQLIGIVSHDLRNPLSTVSIAASLLQDRPLGAFEQKIVARMVSATGRASRLINDLLDFAQARGGGIPIRRAPTNLRAVVRQVTDEIELGAPSQRIELRHDGDEVGEWDEGRLAQVIGNLVGNALQHGPPDGAVSVHTSVVGERASIEVHNDGAPIAESDRAGLFEPFTRGSGAQSPRERSVGLGLYIARVIVAAHQGEITVASTAEAGTSFRVTLPRRSAASEGAA